MYISTKVPCWMSSLDANLCKRRVTWLLPQPSRTLAYRAKTSLRCQIWEMHICALVGKRSRESYPYPKLKPKPKPAQSASRVQSPECRGSEVRRVVGLVRVQKRCKANRAHFSRTRLCACTLQIIAEPLRGILLPSSHYALVLLPSTPDQLDGPLGFYASTWACTCCPSGASYLPAMLWLPGLLHSIACP